MSPLKTRSVATIESVTMSLVDAAPEDEGDATEVGGNECRLVVRLNCKHGQSELLQDCEFEIELVMQG